MAEQYRLSLEKTYQAILTAARAQRFITYAELADANRAPWNKVRRLMPNHLGRLVTIAHERAWPLLSAIIVSQKNIETGSFEQSALDGFIAATRDVGVSVDDPEAFVREQQQKVFAWANTAPESLGVTDESAEPAAPGPRFVEYFPPVLDALRDLGGEATPHDVFAWVRDHVDVPQEELSGTNKGGQSKFENKVAWARFYLVKAGLMDGGKRGVWVLTPEGRETHLDHDAALAITKEVQARFKTPEDEEEPAPDVLSDRDLFDDSNRRFWFVGAVWDRTDDQLERFLKEGIWQNGYDEKFSEHVKRMRPGDRIAIKASFVKKNNLPFDNRGKPVSCMRIKAVGTITENIGDGRTVKVEWERLDPPRDWFFYTYRVTVVDADPNDALALRLILFAFTGAQQDYSFWINDVPYFARKYSADAKTKADALLDTEDEETEEEASVPSYTVDDILAEGCFLPREAIEEALQRTQTKKNLILQGPPGTGKTWLAKKLAYALVGSKDKKVTRGRLRVVQFHPSLSYEDFVRGYRPSTGGGLELVDGIFLESVQAAAAEPDRPFVLIIEEINRGNPAQIFGEMLTLLESTKRTLEDAIELAYRREQGERVNIPKNLYVIGTMNIADRSLALVDLALRRRFAFINLDPQLNGAWREWCTQRCGLDGEVVNLIEERLVALNREIEEDRSLGGQYRIGHSYVTPMEGGDPIDGHQWFKEVAQTEIIPLLEEYWFDAPEKVLSAREKLLLGL